METTIPGIYVAGDMTGIEEANTAMEEGRLAGLAIGAKLGYLAQDEAGQRMLQVQKRLSELRLGQFGEHRARAKAEQMAADPDATPGPREASAAPAQAAGVEVPARRGVAVSGVHCEEELRESPGYPDLERLQKGGVAVIECVQDIPCNPCELACHQGAIRVGVPITNLPVLNDEDCSGCGLCIAACPGLAVFVVDLNYSETEATVTFPYEYLPLPQVGDVVEAVDREGEPVTKGRVTRVQNPPAFNHTAVVTIAVPKEHGEVVRGIWHGRES
jgi:Fe-S-cluster-containing hydrogenase component 2